MPIGIYVVIIGTLIIFGFFTLMGVFGSGSKQNIIGIIMWIMIIPMAFICFVDRKQDIRHESINYYSCISFDFGKNIGKKILCITPNQEIIINNLKLIYPDNIIVKEYQYLAKKGWVNWMNEEIWCYDIIFPTDEEYEKAENIVIMVNSKNLLSKGILQ